MQEDTRPLLAAAIGEVGMGWGHVQRALLNCRRTGRDDVTQIAVELHGMGVALVSIEDRLRRIFASPQ